MHARATASGRPGRRGQTLHELVGLVVLSCAVLTTALGVSALFAVRPRQAVRPEERVRRDLETIRFGLDVYFVRHGAYPASLDEMVKAGMWRHVPTDPWGQAYRYQPAAVSNGPERLTEAPLVSSSGSGADFEPLRLPDPLATRDPKGRPFIDQLEAPAPAPASSERRPHDELTEVFGIDLPRSVVHPRRAPCWEVRF